MTLLEVLKLATGYLESHGSTSPRLDAELLLAHALGVRRLDLYLQFERQLAEAELGPYRTLIDRRGKGQPVAYLVGHKEFMKLDFEVTPAVPVPNPDTEVLVLRAVELARAQAGEVRVADVGTGSGCIAVAVAHYVPKAHVFASDDSPEALAVAHRNVAAHGLEQRVELLAGDLLGPLPEGLDLVCANLPYVAAGAQLPAEVLAQPRHALFGEGLVERLLREAPPRLAAGGVVLAEADPPLLERLLAVAAPIYAGHRVHQDLGGHARVLEVWEPRPWTS